MLSHMPNTAESPNSVDLLKQVVYVEHVAAAKCGDDKRGLLWAAQSTKGLPAIRAKAPRSRGCPHPPRPGQPLNSTLQNGATPSCPTCSWLSGPPTAPPTAATARSGTPAPAPTPAPSARAAPPPRRRPADEPAPGRCLLRLAPNRPARRRVPSSGLGDPDHAP